MDEKQLRCLVALQDIDIMIQETEGEQKLGFKTEGINKLKVTREELTEKIEKPLFRRYERLRQHYKRAVVPVQDNTCLGCFVKLPTSLTTRGKENIEVYTCENCGRILYWLD